MEKITLRFLYLLEKSGMDKVIEFCKSLGLISSEYICPKCGAKMKLKRRPTLTDEYEWSCRLESKFHHAARRSIRTGSFFAKSRIPLTDILLMMHYFVLNISHNVIKSELNLSSRSVCDWRSFFRDICLDACLRMNEPIGGEGVIVEIDEKKFGISNRRTDVLWVFGGVERGSNKCFFRVVERRDKETILNIIKTSVLPGTTIYSNCWDSYNYLEDEGFQHLSVNHSLFFKDPETGIHTNGMMGTWNAIKKSLPNRTVSDHFDSYLGEYMWRRRHADANDLTRVFFQDVRNVYPLRSRDALPGEVGENGDRSQDVLPGELGENGDTSRDVLPEEEEKNGNEARNVLPGEVRENGYAFGDHDYLLGMIKDGKMCWK